MDDNGRTFGTVQWFSRVKGYGFIRPDEQEEDVFVHYSAINGEGYRNLSEGQRVEFTMEDSPKGPQAVDVVGLDSGESEPVDVVGLDSGEGEPAEASF
jgi:CspA family cold shock protein